MNEKAFDLLAMSLDTSPNEAWISTRRIAIVVPLVAIAPEPLQKRILYEFRQLIRSGYEGIAARSYFAATPPVRSLLLAQTDRLSFATQKASPEELRKSHC